MLLFFVLFFIGIGLEQSITKAIMHSLDLGVVLQGVRTELTTDTGLLEASEGSLVSDHIVIVHPHGTCLEGIGYADGSVDVLSVYTGGET